MSLTLSHMKLANLIYQSFMKIKKDQQQQTLNWQKTCLKSHEVFKLLYFRLENF